MSKKKIDIEDQIDEKHQTLLDSMINIGNLARSTEDHNNVDFEDKAELLNYINDWNNDIQIIKNKLKDFEDVVNKL